MPTQQPMAVAVVASIGELDELATEIAERRIGSTATDYVR